MRKKQGDKNKDWETKALILLYIVDNEPAQTDDVREYARTLDKKSVKTKNLIYKHLKDLEKKHKLIERISQGQGKLDSFKIIGGFEGFKNIYLFMKIAGHEKDLIKTAYYKEYTQTTDFREKIRVHFFKQNMLKIHQDIKDEEKRKQVIDELNKSSSIDAKKCIEAIEMIKNDDKSNPVMGELIELFNTIENNDIDKLYKIMRDRLRTSPDSKAHIPDIDKYSDVYTNMLIPSEQHDNFGRILAISPSAIDFVLNSSYYDSNILLFSLATYYVPALSKDMGFIRKLFFYDVERDEGINLDKLLQTPYENIDMDFLTTKSQQYMKNIDSSFMYILRSLLISDIVNGQIIRDNSTQESLKQIFSTNLLTNLSTNLYTKDREA